MFNEFIDPGLIRYRVCRCCGIEFMAKNLKMVFCNRQCSNTYYNQYKRNAAPYANYLHQSDNSYGDGKNWEINCDFKNTLNLNEIKMIRNLEILRGLQLKENEKIVIEKILLENIEFDFSSFINEYQYTNKINNEKRYVYQFENYSVEFVTPTITLIQRSY